MATTATKTVQIIARYQLKKNGYICYSVRSSNGKDQYCTTLNAQGKATGCSCPAVKPCYHMKQLETKEAERRGATPPVAPAQVTGQPTQDRFATLFIINDAKKQMREQAAKTEAANQKRAQAAAKKAREELAELEAQLEQQLAQAAAPLVQPKAMPVVTDIEKRLAFAGLMR